MLRKARKLHTYENSLESFLENHSENIFGKYFWFLKIVYKDIVKEFFKRKALEANASFNVFESQCPKIMVLSKALKAKLFKYPKWSCRSVDASPRGAPFNHPSRRCSCKHISRLRVLGCFLFCVKEGCFTPGTWLEFGSILSDYQM